MSGEIFNEIIGPGVVLVVGGAAGIGMVWLMLAILFGGKRK